MTRTCSNLDIAYANDDDYDLDVCPGCGADITGWQRYDAHLPPWYQPPRPQERKHRRELIGLPDPFTSDSSLGHCQWTRDYLSARAFRRRYIKEHADA